jgi:hypothetical protein
MEEAAVFNRPLDSMSLEAKDSPLMAMPNIQETSLKSVIPELSTNNRASSASLTSSRTSSENRFSDTGSPDTSSVQLQKRPRRKLTKHKINSDVTIQEQQQPLSPPVVERVSAERPRGVLTKKAPPQRSASTTTTEDGQKIENTPFDTRADDGRKSSSTSQGSTSLKDRLFPS